MAVTGVLVASNKRGGDWYNQEGDKDTRDIPVSLESHITVKQGRLQSKMQEM